MALVRAQVVQLLGIGVQIEELETVAGRIVDQFVLVLPDHAGGHGPFAHFAEEIGAPLLPDHRYPLDAIRDRDAGEVEQGWHDILPADEAVILAAGGRA